MKKHSLIFSEVFSFFRNWLNRKETISQQAELLPATTPEEVLHLCCNMIRSTEKQVRLQAKRLNPYIIKKVSEPDVSLRYYKGFRIESEEYALWCELFNPDGKPRNENTYLCCQTILLFFHDPTKVDDFLQVLNNEEQFQCLWDNCWLDLEKEHIKITLGRAPEVPELPYYLTFTAWNEKLRKTN